MDCIFELESSATIHDLAEAIYDGMVETYRDPSEAVEDFIAEVTDATCGLKDQVENPEDYDDVSDDAIDAWGVISEFFGSLRLEAEAGGTDETKAHDALTWVHELPTQADFEQDGYFLAKHPEYGVNFYPREMIAGENLPWMFIPHPDLGGAKKGSDTTMYLNGEPFECEIKSVGFGDSFSACCESEQDAPASVKDLDKPAIFPEPGPNVGIIECQSLEEFLGQLAKLGATKD